jgi:hypothetical protein
VPPVVTGKTEQHPEQSRVLLHPTFHHLGKADVTIARVLQLVKSGHRFSKEDQAQVAAIVSQFSPR